MCVILLQIVKRYDILLIQEVRDRSQTSIDKLVDAINEDIELVSECLHLLQIILMLTTFEMCTFAMSCRQPNTGTSCHC